MLASVSLVRPYSITVGALPGVGIVVCFVRDGSPPLSSRVARASVLPEMHQLTASLSFRSYWLNMPIQLGEVDSQVVYCDCFIRLADRRSSGASARSRVPSSALLPTAVVGTTQVC